MAFNDLEFHAVNREVKQFVDSIRPPEHLRNELDIVYHISDQTIEIGEQRQAWRSYPGDTHYFPSAKIKYNRALDKWQLYWMRRDLKWYKYSVEDNLSDALAVVRADPDYCFWR